VKSLEGEAGGDPGARGVVVIPVDGRPSANPISGSGTYGAVEFVVRSWVVACVVEGGAVGDVVVKSDIVVSVLGVVVAGRVGVVGTSVAAGASTGTTMLGSGVGAGRTRTYSASVNRKTPVRTIVEVRGRWRIKKPGSGRRFLARPAR
jgi:hypothetical protein